eukprot:NODE_8364_length_413_cov_21.299451_g7492_i0.p1 GENE.NODE_8364_length_413_cov_21.299451_g7492_i0~~NODE_8364_length_413_cov_21.299451_g7492_i0.p1  ORF type:complete len:108 (-),score=31.02 NODE_8364_length_413_cov_21.299451_g7492_i0:89-370(-)
MLVSVKQGWMDKMTEKRINRHLNLLIRMPGMLLAAYLGLVALVDGRLQVNTPLASVMVLGCLAHSYNAIYYCDKVVGNYHVTMSLARQERKSD